MKAITKDTRLKTRELIAATDRSEEVIITFRGRERARLVPLDDRQPGVAAKGRNPAFGLWRDQTGPVEEQIDSLRKNRAFD